MSMVKEPAKYSNEVSGIMVGYKGHVPRARDKIGSNPLGGLPNARTEFGFPDADSTSPDKLRGYGTQTSKSAESDLYVSTSHAAQMHSAQTVAGERSQSPTKINTWNEKDGYIPRYSGHMPTAIKQVGGSVYGSK
jgi:hypothetical protein